MNFYILSDLYVIINKEVESVEILDPLIRGSKICHKEGLKRYHKE